MAPLTRRTAFPKVLIGRDSDSEQSSSEEEEQEQEQTLEEEDAEEEDGVITTNEKTHKLELRSDANGKGKAPITISLKKVCKVTFFFLLIYFSLQSWFFFFFFSSSHCLNYVIVMIVGV